MASCSAYNCSNKIGQNLENITFHRFPVSKPDQLSKWLIVMRKEKWQPTKNDLICSEHFTDDQFVENSGYRFLIYNAVPTRFEVLAPPKKLFPTDHPARLLTIKDIECENRNGYVVEARIPLQSKEKFIDWLKEHEKLAQVTYYLLRNYPTTSKALIFKAEYVCASGEQTVAEKPCPARLLVRIRADPKFRFNKSSNDEPASITTYPCTVVLYHLHNHKLGSNAVEIKNISTKEVSTLVKQKFIEMFKGGYSKEIALNTHQKDLLEEYADEYEEVLHDTYINPSENWLNKFYSNFLEEFGEWDNEKMINILKDEIEDINATKGKAKVSLLGQSTIIALSTALMQRVHSLKASGEIVFVDNSGYLERCGCYVYTLMAYSCAEGLPLGLIITTSDSEEILTVAFQLLAEILPEKAFGQFGKQGPEVFLTANDKALQNSLKKVYPDTAVLLCAYNMSHALWRWLWNPKNNIEESDRCTLFSLTHKIMKTKSPLEFQEQNVIILADEIVHKYSNFKNYFEEIKSISDRWAVCFKNEILDKDKDISAIEMASHVLKDKVFLTKAYNILQLLKYYTDSMETYYRQKIINCINYTQESFTLSSYKAEMTEISDLVVTSMPVGQCQVKNIKKNKVYYVDMNICVCSCTFGLNGARCKHMYAICCAKKIDFTIQRFDFTIVPDDDVIKKELFWIATDAMKKGSFDLQLEINSDSETEIGESRRNLTMRTSDPSSSKNKKNEAKRILERVMKSILEKYDFQPVEFHQAIVTAAVNYQNLNNENDIISALKNFGKYRK